MNGDEAQSQTDAAGFLWRAIIVLVFIFIVLGLAFDGEAQITEERRQITVRDIVPKYLDVSIDEMRATFPAGERLRVDYTVDRTDWQRLERKGVALWLQVWVPVDNVGPAFVYGRVRTMWRVAHREGRLVFPAWVDRDPWERVDVCPVAKAPRDGGQRGTGWTCVGTEPLRTSSAGLVQVGKSMSFELQRQRYPLTVSKLYWWAPTGPFLLTRPALRVPWRQLSYPVGRRPMGG
jgi:hypothetical protein